MKHRVRTPLRIHFAAWSALLLFAAAAFLLLSGRRHAKLASPPTTVSTAARPGVYFSEPGSASASTLRGGPDAALAEAVRAARYSVDVAVYRLDLWSIRDALLEAARSGVRVRVVIEGEHAQAPEVRALQAAGIPVVVEDQPALMHHKFAVIDRLEVWTGSMNFTLNGAYRNNNNLVRIQSESLASAFTDEFEEMFLDGRFGALSEPDTEVSRIVFNGGWLEVHFSPDAGVERRLDNLLAEARDSIDLLVFNFTSDLLGERLVERIEAGIVVRGVVERSQAGNDGSEIGRLLDAGAQLRLDRNPNDMHHKVILIDGHIVVTGSYNFSRAAREDNDENLLIIDDADLASQYLIEFSRLFEAAQP